MRFLRVLAGLAVAVALNAQTTSTTILGAVTDSSGAAVEGAKIVARNVGTSVATETLTTGTGDFALPLLDIGEYEVSVEMSGFKSETKKGVRLQINEKVRVDFTLQVGAQSERITVSAEAATLRTDEASVGGTVEQRRLVELPLNGRNVGNFAVLNPGVQFGSRGGYDGQSGGGGGIPIPGQTVAIVANGQREVSQHATLDGVVATEARVNTVPFSPSPEAMEEVKVYSGSYSAEYGFNSGAQLIMVMRSGTNDFHGTAYNFLRNQKLDAEAFFQNYFTPAGAARSPKTALRQNQFGFVVSGPIYLGKLYDGRNKTFFNFNYEGRRRREPGAISTASVPTAAFRNGDLSSLLNRRNAAGAALPSINIVDPNSSPTAPLPFAGNIIPTARITAAARALTSFWPQAQFAVPDDAAGAPNFRNPGTNSINDDQYFLKLDHNFSASDKIFFRYATNIPEWFSITNNPNFSYLVAGRNHNYATQWLHVFTPRMINEFRFGYTQSRSDSFNPRANTDFTLPSIGINGFNVLTDGNRPLTQREVGIPAMNVTGFTGLAERDGGNGFDDNKLYQISDNVSYTTGAHTFKAGIDTRRVTLFRGAANVPRGSFNFNGNLANNAFAAFLLGAPTSTDSPEGLPLTDVKQWRTGFYFQDDWKAARKLTVNLGLRWEYNTAATDVRGLWRSFEWRNGLSSPPEFVPAKIRTTYDFYKPQKKMLMPRIGLAYRLTDAWVIRSGFGIYYNIHQLNNYTILNLNPPLSGSSNYANTASNGVLVPGAAVYSFASPFGAVNSSSAVSANVLNTDNYQPYVAQWSFDLQRRLPWATTLSVGYVGSKTTHLDNTVEINNPDPFIPVNAADTVQSRRPFPFVIDDGVRRPLTRTRFLDSGGNSWYQGLQVSLRKEMTNGLLFTLAYTYSKTLMEGYGRNEGDGINSNTYQNPRNRVVEKGRVGFGAEHIAVMSMVYDVPTPAALKKGIAGHVFSGWQTNSIITLRTGFPFTVGQGNILNTANSPARPDRIGSGAVDNPTINRWFDVDAFRLVSCTNSALPELCHYGNSGNGILDGPGQQNVDFSAFKNFRISERVKFQFRGEFFNIFNTPQFGVPNRNLNTGGGFLPTRNASGQVVFPSQAGVTGGVGTVTSLVAPMRNIQFGLKLIW
ncbi:MAG: TonB-dependent receptor [Acidobacteria bacterium]|nr:TonB-dependent receptor [Acidobacteriota bacterium]